MLELIASDMDGTLLNGELNIPEKNREAIMHTYSLGIPFIICTGRNFTEAQVILAESGIRCPIIGLNGAIQFSRDGDVEFEIALPDECALEIIQYGQENGFYMEAMTSVNVYSNSKESRIRMLARTIASRSEEGMSEEEALTRASQSTEVKSILYMTDLCDLVNKEGQKILKITFNSSEGPKVLEPLEQAIHSRYPDLTLTSSFKYNLEVSAGNANKGTAIVNYCQKHGYNLNKVMTIGDNLNDIPMLEVAGLSFAMANAEDEVKAAAKYQTGSNNAGGVADAIHRALELTGTPSSY